MPGGYGATSLSPAGSVTDVYLNGQFYGSPADLARVLKPELARLA